MLDHLLSYVVFFVVGLELVSFRLRTVPSYRAYIKHPGTKLDKRASFLWNLQVSDIVQAKVDKLLQLRLAHGLKQRRRR